MNTIPQSYHGKPLIHAWNYCSMDGAPFGVVGRYQDGSGKKDIVPVLGFKLKKVDVTGCVAVHPKLKGMLTCVG